MNELNLKGCVSAACIGQKCSLGYPRGKSKWPHPLGWCFSLPPSNFIKHVTKSGGLSTTSFEIFGSQSAGLGPSMAWFGMACFQMIIRVSKLEAIFTRLVRTHCFPIGVHMCIGDGLLDCCSSKGDFQIISRERERSPAQPGACLPARPPPTGPPVHLPSPLPRVLPRPPTCPPTYSYPYPTCLAAPLTHQDPYPTHTHTCPPTHPIPKPLPRLPTSQTMCQWDTGQHKTCI